MNILLCFGTRPEAIKMAPLVHEFRKTKFQIKVCVTGQHREMLDQVLSFFEIVPSYDLNLMRSNQTLNELSSRIILEIDKILSQEKFDLVLVHGDTTTSIMVALAAFHKGIKIGHVEAGLRTYNKYSPFPEEINRQLTGRVADIHFAPTNRAKANLLSEGVKEELILVTGNTIIDALFLTLDKIKNGYKNETIKQLESQIDFSKKIVLVTGHRRESFGLGFENICKAILEISRDKELEIVYPVHLNPNVQTLVYERLSNVENIHLIEPIDYPSFIWLMSNSSLIISDSGGIQEEAPSLQIPVIVTRNTTERFEGVEAGFSFLTGTEVSAIVLKAKEILQTEYKFNIKENPYGAGKASHKIIEYIKNQLN